MPAHATIHSDSPDGAKVITLTQTGMDIGTIQLLAPNHDQTFVLKDIQADLTSLTLICALDAFFSADITVTVKRATAGPIASVTIAHAFLGNGTVDYPLRKGDDGVMEAFLKAAGFPPIKKGV